MPGTSDLEWNLINCIISVSCLGSDLPVRQGDKETQSSIAEKRSQPPTSAYSPSGQLREVLRRLRRGELAVAIRMGNDALEAVQRDGYATGVEAARQLLAEAHFRAAAGTTEVVWRLDHLDKALGYAPGLGKLHFYRGLALWQLGRLPEAIPELDAAFAAEPQRPRLAYLRQLARLASGQPWDADKLPAAEANTLHVVAKLLQDKTTEPALAALPGPTLGKGSALWQALLEMRCDASAAPVDLLHQATTENTRRPVQAVLLYYLGVAAARAGATGEASSAWVKARSVGLETPWLRQNQVVFLQGQATEDALTGRWQEFLDAAHQVPLPPGEPLLAELVGIAHYHAGYAAAQAGRWHVAVEHWRQAQELHGSRNVAQNLALAEEKLGHWKQAADAWREMIRRRPRKPEHADYLSDAQVAVIWDHVAECYERAGVTGEALVTLKNAAKYAPESVDRRLKLVDALVGEERDEAAINELRRILELDPQHEDALMRLGALQTVVAARPHADLAARAGGQPCQHRSQGRAGRGLSGAGDPGLRRAAASHVLWTAHASGENLVAGTGAQGGARPSEAALPDGLRANGDGQEEGSPPVTYSGLRCRSNRHRSCGQRPPRVTPREGLRRGNKTAAPSAPDPGVAAGLLDSPG